MMGIHEEFPSLFEVPGVAGNFCIIEMRELEQKELLNKAWEATESRWRRHAQAETL
jgi:hypothetical protein